MSSLIGHTLIGSALFARDHKIDCFQAVIACFLTAGLAVSPDVDYIIQWFFNYRIEPRYTHSIAYCLTVGMIAWGLKASFCHKLMGLISTPVLFLAPISHLVLDLCVGVYPMPLFWPLTDKTIVIPFGILPSAGRLQLTNYYFWRNLLIEMGILLPIIMMMIPRLKDAVLKDSRYRQWAVFAIFLCFVVWGISLKR